MVVGHAVEVVEAAIQLLPEPSAATTGALPVPTNVENKTVFAPGRFPVSAAGSIFIRNKSCALEIVFRYAVEDTGKSADAVVPVMYNLPSAPSTIEVARSASAPPKVIAALSAPLASRLARKTSLAPFAVVVPPPACAKS